MLHHIAWLCHIIQYRMMSKHILMVYQPNTFTGGRLQDMQEYARACKAPDLLSVSEAVLNLSWFMDIISLSSCSSTSGHEDDSADANTPHTETSCQHGKRSCLMMFEHGLLMWWVCKLKVTKYIALGNAPSKFEDTFNATMLPIWLQEFKVCLTEVYVRVRLPTLI